MSEDGEIADFVQSAWPTGGQSGVITLSDSLVSVTSENDANGPWTGEGICGRVDGA
jgi:hypothetical protein